MTEQLRRSLRHKPTGLARERFPHQARFVPWLLSVPEPRLP